MRHRTTLIALALVASGLAGCSAPEPVQDEAGSDASAAGAASPAAAIPDFDTRIPLAALMRGTVTFAAYDYWESVSIVVDAEGTHENYPQDEEEWERVWAAALTVAESGNLMMMPSRALDQGEWIRMSQAMVDVGIKAAQAAEDQDYEAVLDVGEEIYNVCTECHETYIPSLRL